MSPSAYLHAGAVVTVADSLCGYGCVVNLPDGAVGFTTIELFRCTQMVLWKK